VNHLDTINEFFQTESLKAKGQALNETYRTAQPYPHIVIDDFFPPEILDEVLAAVESPDSRWHHFDNDREIKRQLCDDTKMHPDSPKQSSNAENARTMARTVDRPIPAPPRESAAMAAAQGESAKPDAGRQ